MWLPSRSLRRLSLTLRLALLYTASTVLVLCAVAIHVLTMLDAHFAEQDVTEMRGKLELAARLVAKARMENDPDALPFHLDDALVGHHHLTLGLFAGATRRYGNSALSLPPALLAAAAGRAQDAPLVAWQENGRSYRGLALRLTPDAGAGLAAVTEEVVAVAVDTQHHTEFIAQFQLALWSALGFAALVAAALGWGVTRAGLAPLRQITELSRQITAERLHERLPAEEVPPELRALATAFNAMLDRLRDSFERLSGFAADLAHEMRTPVSNLMTQTQVTLGRTRSVDAYRDVLASNLEEYERLARMIADMLFLAKADNGLIVPCHESVDLAAEVGALFGFYEALAEEAHVRLQVSGKATITGDRLMLRRAIANLLSNAIRHTTAGGTVSVMIDATAAGTRLVVTNPGPPLLPEQRARLFERFYRADPARREEPGGRANEPNPGHGLGLAIVRSIARAHGGEASVRQLADGIAFELELPEPPTAPA